VRRLERSDRPDDGLCVVDGGLITGEQAGGDRSRERLALALVSGKHGLLDRALEQLPGPFVCEDPLDEFLR
jgi:hypothetical protein